jgi:Flp pilus assembly pilin Flp
VVLIEETPMQSPTAALTLKRLSIARFRRAEDGQDLLEYGLLVSLIAVFALGAVAALGTTISNVFWSVIANSF